MNARDYKIFRSGHCYHVYNRGNNKQNIFLSESDYLVFLKRIKLLLGIAKIPFASAQRESLQVKYPIRIKPFEKDSFSLLSYCLMPNHFHFLIRQNTDIGIDKFMLKLSTSYAKYFNVKHERVGNLFQDAFKAKIVENDRYLMYLSAYIHNNPQDPSNYDFSSFKDYLGVRKGEICDKMQILSMFGGSPEAYQKFVLAFSGNDELSIKELLFED